MQAIIAGFGYLGSKIAEVLSVAGYRLTVIRRQSGTESGGLDFKFVACDLAEQVPELAEHDYAVAVFCLAPVTRNEIEYERTYCRAQKNFLEAVRARKFVFISSTAVYRDNAGNYSEADATPHTRRAEILLSAEQMALATPHSCVLRLAGLYSAERPIYSARSPVYDEDKLVHFIHRDDAARAVLHAVKNNLRGVYTVHDGNPQLRSNILRSLHGDTMQLKASARRLLDDSKFSATGFKPLYADYLAGIRKIQN